MKRILYIGLGLVFVLVIAALVVPFVIPNEVYRRQIETAASDALGRDISLEGELSLSLFPRLAAGIDGVTVANPQGFSRAHMVEAGTLRGVVKWRPLLAGRVEIEEFVFIDADIALERLADGRANWEMGPAAGTQPADPPPEAGEEDTAGGGVQARIERATLRNAALSFRDAVTGRAFDLTDFNLTAALPGPGEALRAEADGRFQEEPFRIDVAVAAPEALMTAGESGLDLAARIAGTQADYDGTLSLGETLRLDGAVSLQSDGLGPLFTLADIPPPAGLEAIGALEISGRVAGQPDALQLSDLDLRQSSELLSSRFAGQVGLGEGMTTDGTLSASSGTLRALLAAFDVALAPGETLRSFDVNADVSGSLERLNLSSLEARLDDMQIQGSGVVDLAGERPRLSADLSTGTLDLSPFLAGGSEGPSESAPADEGWSDEPLDLAGLNAVDAELALTAETIRIGDIVLANADLAATLQNGDLDADIASAETFGGLWRGQFGLDASAPVPTTRIALTGTPIDVEPMLQTLADFSGILGTGALTIDVSGRGASFDAIMRSLSGNLETRLEDGAVRGFNIGQLVRSRDSILQGLADGSLALALSPEAETDFTQLLSQLSLSGGVATIRAFELDNPVLSLSGSGSIDLGNRTLDVSLVPELDASGTGAGSALQLNGMPIPFRLTGSWASPSIAPDTELVGDLLQRDVTGRLEDALREELGGELGGLVGEIVGDGGARGDAEDETTDEPPQSPEAVLEDAARDALSDLFSRGRQEQDESEDED